MQPEPLTNPTTVSASTDPATAEPNVAKRIEAWTDQHPANIARLMAEGEYYGDARRGPSVFRPAIRWMRLQMRERIPGAVGHPPVWLTVTPSLERRQLCAWSCLTRADGPCSKLHLTPGKTWVRASIPTSRVLLSDFDLWDRYVLHYKFIPADADDELRWERHARKKVAVSPRESPFLLNPAWPPELVTHFVKSWDRIFDITPGRPTQAAVDSLRPSDVIDTMPSPRQREVLVRFWSNPNSTYIHARSVRVFGAP